MLRQRRHVELRFPQASRSRATSTGSRRTAGDLILRIHGDRVSARCSPVSQLDSPPVLRGSLTDEGSAGFVITGVVRETRAASVTPAALLLVCLAGVLLATLSPSTSTDRTVAVVLGVSLAVLFGALFVMSLRRRGPRFRRQVASLERSIVALLGDD